MKVLICPDAFKGTLSARRVAAAIEDGFRRVAPAMQLDRLGLADGGPGTLAAIAEACEHRSESVTVAGPLGDEVVARFLVLSDGTAVIESAQAIALARPGDAPRAPLLASSRGVGQLIRVALDRGHRSIVVTLGGSATNDAGYGCARALGVWFLEASGRALGEPTTTRPLPDLFRQIEHIELARRHPAIESTTFVVAADVDNPLCGPSGATFVYGPQKGVGEHELAPLEQAIAGFASKIEVACGVELRDLAGGGAAGGLGGTLAAFCSARITSGFDWVATRVGLDERIRAADVVVTGEGRIDAQTRCGKTVAGVGRRARAIGRPVIAIAGRVELDRTALDALGIDRVFSCSDDSPADERAAYDLVVRAAGRAATAIVEGRGRR